MQDPDHATDISEERRLCYVGITRAQRKLYLTRACTRVSRGRVVPRTPSRFLLEIPDELLEVRDLAEEARQKVPAAEVGAFFASFARTIELAAIAVRALDHRGDLGPRQRAIEPHADPAARADVRWNEVMLGIALDEHLLHAVGTHIATARAGHRHDDGRRTRRTACRRRTSPARRGSVFSVTSSSAMHAARTFATRRISFHREQCRTLSRR